MPDVLHWLGVRRIHRLVSMSNMKYDAIVGSGIEVGERVKIPEGLVPADARVEIDAKKAAGYFTDGDVPDAAASARDEGTGAVMLTRRTASARSELAVDARDPRALRATSRAQSTRGTLERISASTARAARLPRARSRDVTRRRYPRSRHSLSQPLAAFRSRAASTARASSIARLQAARDADRARAHIDLAVISVLLDAGAGSAWRYRRAGNGRRFTRSEGLGVASFRAFHRRTLFRRSPGEPMRVDAAALTRHRCRDARPLFQVECRQSAGRPRRPRGAAATAGRRARNAARSLRAAGASRRAVRSAARADADAFRRLRSCAPLLEGFGPIWRVTPAARRRRRHAHPRRRVAPSARRRQRS